ncbi:hypothetical protein FHS89_003180 [Rubricella aquisinus]|uniref:Transmembrane protein n=1 Tax=Rubricella aquisinus TaxID=2028108 RepID=A0A840X2R4_9RHOB|nr:hypothetical protein [Rubricella aquisinus]MBB5517134.1 hypothetical protein [Rubricella aquisinus]
MIFPVVFLRALPIYALAGVYFWLGFSVNDDLFLRWLLGFLCLFPGLPLMTLMVSRGALMQLRVTEPTALDRIIRGALRLGAFQGLIWLLLSLVLMAPMGLAIHYTIGFPKVTDVAFTLEAITEVLVLGQTERLDPRYGLLFVLFAVPTSIAGSFVAIAMAGTAATVVRRPPLIDAIWGVGRRVGSLLLLLLPGAVIFFGLGALLVLGGIIPLVADLTRSQVIGVLSPALIAMALWLPLLASAGAVGYDICRKYDDAEKAARLSAGLRAMPEPEDIRSLRAARQKSNGKQP